MFEETERLKEKLSELQLIQRDRAVTTPDGGLKLNLSLLDRSESADSYAATPRPGFNKEEEDSPSISQSPTSTVCHS